MKLEVLRFSGGEDTTLGLLFDVTGKANKFLCFTLEDEHRDIKVSGETRIPAGTYNVTLRTWGGKHKRYLARYPNMHKGMLWVRDVPGFQYILIHVGNDEDDTEGCLLVGDSCTENLRKPGFVGASRAAYERIYPPIAKALERNVEVTIRYIDY